MNRDLLLKYKELIQSTDCIAAYREFVRMFRWLRRRLEEELPEYRFQGRIKRRGHVSS